VTPSGTVAGLVDPSWGKLDVVVTGRGHHVVEGEARGQDGLFVYLSAVPTQGAAIVVQHGDDPSTRRACGRDGGR
jgi:hypothetical protein